jgi:hypothetical protein
LGLLINLDSEAWPSCKFSSFLLKKCLKQPKKTIIYIRNRGKYMRALCTCPFISTIAFQVLLEPNAPSPGFHPLWGYAFGTVRHMPDREIQFHFNTPVSGPAVIRIFDFRGAEVLCLRGNGVLEQNGVPASSPGTHIARLNTGGGLKCLTYRAAAIVQ